MTTATLTLLLDAVMALTVLEGALLWALHRAGRRVPAPGDVLPNLVSGLCLMLALRAALAGWPWGLMWAALAASGIIHAGDLWRRWPRR